MQNKTHLFNSAVSLCGGQDDISSPDETSRAAELCTQWYDVVRQQVLRAAYWNCAGRFFRLPVLAERVANKNWTELSPAPGWQYAYGLPADYLIARNLVSYGRFKLGVYPTETRHALFTNNSEAVLNYTVDVKDIALWDSGLYLAVIHALAAYIVMPLTGKPQLRAETLRLANFYIQQEHVNDANEDAFMYTTLPDWIEARGYTGGVAQTRYFYPHVSLPTTGI